MTTRRVGVGVVGAGWMGHVHARAYVRVPHHYPDLELRPVLVAVSDVSTASAADALDRYGFARAYPDWHDLVADPDINVVSVTLPNALHREVGAAVAAQGKHLWIEKPVGLSAADAEAVAHALAAAGVVAAVGFNYRNVPAVAHARELVASGAIGEVTHARVRMFTDYAADPRGMLSWRFVRERGGNGVLGDLMSHGVDLTRFVIGELSALTAQTARFIDERPLASAPGSHYATIDEITATTPMGAVENDDYAVALARTSTGAFVVLEASRAAVGDQNAYGFEVHGTRGQVSWDFRRPGELQVASGASYLDLPTTRVMAGPGHGVYALFQPGSGIATSYDDTKVIEAANLLMSIAAGAQPVAGLHDAVMAARALDAMERSAADGSWVDLTSG